MYTEIYFEKDDPEIVEYFEELEKSLKNEPCDVNVLRQWYSEPVKIYEPGAKEGVKPDYIYAVLVRDLEYLDRRDLFATKNEDIDEKNDSHAVIAAKEARNAKRIQMKIKKASDRTFKKLDKKWKRSGEPAHVFGPNGKTHDAPEEREDDQGDDEQ